MHGRSAFDVPQRAFIAAMRSPRERPGYVIPMAVMTACYLMFELGFNARLLDVTGGFATSTEIGTIERCGRLISGVAVTLAVWGVLLRCCHEHGVALGGQVAACMLTAAIFIGACFAGERSLIDRIVDHSGGGARRAALHLRTVSAAMLQGAATIEGIDLSAGELSSPEGKAFLSLFPFIALSTGDLTAKTERVLDDVLRWSAAKTLGPPADAYNSAFIGSVRDLQARYNAYADGVDRYGRALSRIPGEQSAAWSRYEASLRQQMRTPYNVPPRNWAQVGNSLRAEGIGVPSGWNPSDRGAFNVAIASRIGREAGAAFERESRSAAGAALPAGMQWKEFCAHPAIQAKWRSALGVPDGVRLSPDMGFPAYRDTVYQPTVDRQVHERHDALLLPESAYADGGSHEDEGRSAMKSLVVPPFALTLSLAGALVHLFKSANYITRAASPGFGDGFLGRGLARLPFGWRTAKRGQALLAAVALLALSAFFLPNRVSRSAAFSYFERQTVGNFGPAFGPAAATGSRWVVQAQPFFYPLNEAIRRHVLLGLGYGYRAD